MLVKTITPLLWRVIVFLCLFIAMSGIIGPKVISGGILFTNGFAAYGSIGKALIFGLIAFLLLVRHNKTTVRLQTWEPPAIVWLLITLAAFAFADLGINRLIAGQHTFENQLLAHGGLWLSIFCAALACFEPRNILLVWRTYRREFSLAIGFSVAFYIFLFAVYGLWQPLASIVMLSVNWLLEIINLHAGIVPPNTLLFDKFGVTISEYCSGVESIALFTSLYAVVGLLDWNRLNKRRFFMLFPFALVLLFLLNIVRVFGLIVAGYFIDPDIAFSLFHTYAGLLFFVFYSAVFWAIAYSYVINVKKV